MPRINSIRKENIADYEIQKSILHHYGLQGRTYSAVQRAVDWMVNYRVNASVEMRYPWSDNFTNARNGEFSILEGCWSILFVVYHLENITGSLQLLPKNRIFVHLATDLLRVTTGHEDPVAAEDAINEFLTGDRLETDHFYRELAHTCYPYVSNEDDKPSLFATEAASLLVRTLILFLKVAGNHTLRDYLQPLLSEVPKFEEYAEKVLIYLIRNLTEAGIKRDGFGPFLKAPFGWQKEIDLYSTYVGLLALFDYTEFCISDSGRTFQLQSEVNKAIQDVYNTILKNRRSSGKNSKVGWAKLFKQRAYNLQGTIFGLLSLMLILRLREHEKDDETTELKSIVHSVMQESVLPEFKDELLAKKYFVSDSSLQARQEVKDKLELGVVVHENWGIVFPVFGMKFYYIKALAEYIDIFGYKVSPSGKEWDWTPSWEMLDTMIESALEHYTQEETVTGFCWYRGESEQGGPLVSLRMTALALDILDFVGLDKEAQSGMLDVVRETMVRSADQVVRRFHDKYYELESLGYRIAWRNIQLDFDRLGDAILKQDRNTYDDIDEFELFLRIETALSRGALDVKLDKEALRKWRAVISERLIKNDVDQKALSTSINEIIKKAKSFNESVDSIVSNLMRTQDPSDFRLICNDAIKAHQVNGVIGMYEMHDELIRALRLLRDEELRDNALRLSNIWKVISKVMD